MDVQLSLPSSPSSHPRLFVLSSLLQAGSDFPYRTQTGGERCHGDLIFSGLGTEGMDQTNLENFFRGHGSNKLGGLMQGSTKMDLLYYYLFVLTTQTSNVLTTQTSNDSTAEQWEKIVDVI